MNFDLSTHVERDRWRKDAKFPQLHGFLARRDETAEHERLIRFSWLPEYGAVLSINFLFDTLSGEASIVKTQVGTADIDGLHEETVSFDAHKATCLAPTIYAHTYKRSPRNCPSACGMLSAPCSRESE